MNRPLRALLIAAAAVAALAPAADALALDCVTLPKPVYVAGSSAAKPLLIPIGRALALANPPVTLVYRSLGSCVGVDAILHGTVITGSGANAASYWDGSGTELKCDIDVAGVPADIGLSDVF